MSPEERENTLKFILGAEETVHQHMLLASHKVGCEKRCNDLPAQSRHHRLQLAGLTGAQVHMVMSLYRLRGYHWESFVMRCIPSGVYIVRADVGDERMTERVLYLK